MRRVLRVIPAIALTLIASGIPARAQVREPGSSSSHIVVLKPTGSDEAIGSAARRVLDEARQTIPSIRFRQRGVPTFPMSRVTLARDDVIFSRALAGFAVEVDRGDVDKLAHVQSHPDVAYVAEDRLVELYGQTFQPGMERIRVRGNALTAINDAADVDVDVDIAVIDSGIDATHPDLNVYESVSFVTDDPTPIDRIGHGTHVAGIAAAIDDEHGIHGVAPGARLWAVKVFGTMPNAAISDIITGLDYVTEHADEIDVVNLSLGGLGIGDDGDCGNRVGDPLHQAICGVVDAGVVVVVSAGNYVPYGRDASLISPAAYDEVITVSAVVETDGAGPAFGQGPGTIYGADNGFARALSNYGWDVDIAAPGVNVVSTMPGGTYAEQSGTSVAAPFVSGAAALWIAEHGKPFDAAGVGLVRDEIVRLGFPQAGPDEGFHGDKEHFAEPLLNVAALAPGVFDPVEPRLSTDRPVYTAGVETAALITARIRDTGGQPLDGIPGNGFEARLAGRYVETPIEPRGDGEYQLSLDIDGLLPGDYDLTVLISNESGFMRSAGCRVVIRDAEPRLRLHAMAFAWPVLSPAAFTTMNPLGVRLMNERGAPVVADAQAFETTFSGGGDQLVWSLPFPDYQTGVNAGITYGVMQTAVQDTHALPLGIYSVDLTVTHAGSSGSATASFEMAVPESTLAASLSANVSRCDFTQTIPPPPLSLAVRVTSEWGVGVSGLNASIEQPLTLIVDGQPVSGLVFEEDPFDLGTYVLEGFNLEHLSHGLHRFAVHVEDSRGLEAQTHPVTIPVIRETGPCADPSNSQGQLDTDGDGFRDECDNCPAVANPSQRSTFSSDPSETGLGDACKSHARVRVSSAISDNPDFLTIMGAVNGATAAASGIRVEILPGIGPYVENVVVDRDRSFHLEGIDIGSGPPVIESAGAGGDILELRSSGSESIVVEGLVFRGQGPAAGGRGIVAQTDVSTHLLDLRFEQLGLALRLQDGDHQVERIEVDATVDSGVLAENARVALNRGEFRGVSRAIHVVGPSALVRVENMLSIGNGSGEGIRNESPAPGSLEVLHSTLVHGTIGISGIAGNTTVANSIVWLSQTAIDGVRCEDVEWSVLQDTTCGGSNVSHDPRFADHPAGDYRLAITSPVLDHGAHPAGYAGRPCTDLDGDLRLRDHDDDGLAQADPGAYERASPGWETREATGVAWTDHATMIWDPLPSAVRYHVYRSSLDSLTYFFFGTCEDGLDTTLIDTWLSDNTVPAPGQTFFYEVTAVDGSGEEHTLGTGSCAERSNYNACP